MPLHATYIAEEERLDLSVDGDLDLTVTQGICEACRRASPTLRTCIIDLSNVDRVFDSGVALVQMLYRRLSTLGTAVIVLTDHPRIRELIPFCRAPVDEPAARLST
jgi:ABC-type transporter Mla MlaB component